MSILPSLLVFPAGTSLKVCSSFHLCGVSEFCVLWLILPVPDPSAVSTSQLPALHLGPLEPHNLHITSFGHGRQECSLLSAHVSSSVVEKGCSRMIGKFQETSLLQPTYLIPAKSDHLENYYHNTARRVKKHGIDFCHSC